MQRFHLFLVLVQRAVGVDFNLDRTAGVLLGQLLELLGSLALGRILCHDVAELDHDRVSGHGSRRQAGSDQTQKQCTNLHLTSPPVEKPTH
ncbi:hypothetical protein SDC9_147475 [bioreactor metagenome]|uniref:Uncharacterized protein n=1 Tax=bioreactor metagenome TaxID=1076179 RepID=A0A645EEF8_9ZZZZ